MSTDDLGGFLPAMAATHSSGSVFIGLGSNLGNRAAHLAGGRRALMRLSRVPMMASPIYESAPWGGILQSLYLNQVVAIVPDRGPDALWAALVAIERSAGRERTQRWGPRTLDLDVLSWTGCQRQTLPLYLPHPHLASRRFVLAPWADLAPEHHVFGQGTVAGLLAACADSGWVRRYC